MSLSLCNSRNVFCFKHFTGTRHCTRHAVWRSRQGECFTGCRMQNEPCLFDRRVILSPQIHLRRFPLRFLQRVLWLNDTSMYDCFSHLIAPPHILNSVRYIKLHSFPHILVFIPLNSIHKSPRYRKLRVTAYFGTIAFRLGRNPRKRPSNSPVRLV